MRNRKHGFVSVLMKKDFEALQTLSFHDVIHEMINKMPELLRFLIVIMLPKKKRNSNEAKAAIVPKLAMIYAIIMQNHCHELSRMQRINAMLLADDIADQGVSVYIPYYPMYVYVCKCVHFAHSDCCAT